MTRSALSIQISIHELVESLNDDDCLDVIKLLNKRLGINNLTTMVNKIITHFTQNSTNKSLIEIEEAIQNTYSSHSTNNQISETSYNVYNETTSNKILFPLIQLPDDILTKTASFLSETDIFQFEQCCRWFYKIINDISYLNQCNNFKNFIITKHRLHQMKQRKYDFFKYSKATQLTSNLLSRSYRNTSNRGRMNYESLLVAALNDFERTMNKMKTMGSYDKWWTSLFKSISCLDLDSSTDIGVLISVMPIDLLFNPKISHLKQIILGHMPRPRGIRGPTQLTTTWNNYMNKFEEKYLQYKKEWNFEMKSLQCIKHVQTSADENLRFIDAKHVWMENIEVDLTDDKFLTNECNPGMKLSLWKIKLDLLPAMIKIMLRILTIVV